PISISIPTREVIPMVVPVSRSIQTTMGMTSLVGILMLIGIVVNNGIVLVDFTNGIRRTEGLSADKAMVKAGRARLKPVMMTAFTTILALLPLSLGGSSSAALWAPMARTVIGGMLLATPLTLVVVPVLYKVMNRGARRRAPRTG
ncbi:MAG TPA: efflux RND transporter permease subunit, partial [Candidatus Sabulitectum sp.]|nr:efflux RND transporter permease subunit [Candidatus Sabulitectum sp.]